MGPRAKVLATRGAPHTIGVACRMLFRETLVKSPAWVVDRTNGA
jgi:hypothetical protein